jgi:hypothetical protein
MSLGTNKAKSIVAIVILCAVLVPVALSPITAEAGKHLGGKTPVEILNLKRANLRTGGSTGFDNMFIVIKRILTIMQTILFAMAGIFTVIAGYQYLTAQGETDKTTSARHSILYAVFAVGAGLLAVVLSILIQNLIGVEANKGFDPFGT